LQREQLANLISNSWYAPPSLPAPSCLQRPNPSQIAEKNIFLQLPSFLNGGRPTNGCIGFDARFPNQNQTKHCWQNYVDYHKCILAKGEDFAPCRQFFLAYRSLCPSGWTSRWDDQRGTDFCMTHPGYEPC
jgi:cytochrome c oxidase subunit 6b